MKTISLLLCLSILFCGNAQEDFTSNDAIKIVDVFFDGFHSGDTLVMKSVLAENVILQSASIGKEGKNTVSTSPISNLLFAIAKRTSDQKWEEKLLDYSVQIDGNLAHVWTSYEFWLNNELSHCGANAFTLAKINDTWKIIHLIDSRRIENCEE